jgi:ADP-ribose pyrophosphatase YjhB (NUDIX family)
MGTNLEMKDFIEQGPKWFLPHLSVDCVIFGFHANQLKILLNKWKKVNGWCLPGGYVLRNESVDDSAKRVLKERTGLSKIFLKQFYTFGEPMRAKNPGMEKEQLSETFGFKIADDNWMFDRVVSIGYFALVEYSKVKPKPDGFSEKCDWFDIQDVPHLFFDHNLILEHALKALRLETNQHPIGFDLLPEKFTLPELLGLYETILNRKLDRRNFQKKILSFNILKKLDERRNIGAHRAPTLYSFDRQRYAEVLKEGLSFIF